MAGTPKCIDSRLELLRKITQIQNGLLRVENKKLEFGERSGFYVGIT